MNSMIFLLISTVTGCGTEIDTAAQPLPTGDLRPGGADFTENTNACPLDAGSHLTLHLSEMTCLKP